MGEVNVGLFFVETEKSQNSIKKNRIFVLRESLMKLKSLKIF